MLIILFTIKKNGAEVSGNISWFYRYVSDVFSKVLSRKISYIGNYVRILVETAYDYCIRKFFKFIIFLAIFTRSSNSFFGKGIFKS